MLTMEFICINTVQLLQFKIQSSVSHDPSEIIVICWIDAQETFINVENSYAAKHFCCDSLLIFCKITNVFTVTFNQFNMSLLNKSIKFFQKKKKHTNTHKILFCVAILRSHTQRLAISSLCKTHYFTYWGGCSSLDIYVCDFLSQKVTDQQ